MMANRQNPAFQVSNSDKATSGVAASQNAGRYISDRPVPPNMSMQPRQQNDGFTASAPNAVPDMMHPCYRQSQPSVFPNQTTVPRFVGSVPDASQIGLHQINGMSGGITPSGMRPAVMNRFPYAGHPPEPTGQQFHRPGAVTSLQAPGTVRSSPHPENIGSQRMPPSQTTGVGLQPRIPFVDPASAMQHPGLMYRPPGMQVVSPQQQYQQLSTPANTSTGELHELPVPYDGQGQYSHQVHTSHGDLSQALTPCGSETPSQRSSRVPSPVTTPNYDDMEGQFLPTAPAARGTLPAPTMLPVTNAPSTSTPASVRPPLPSSTQFPVSSTHMVQPPPAAVPAFGTHPIGLTSNVRPPFPLSTPYGENVPVTYQHGSVPLYGQNTVPAGVQNSSLPMAVPTYSAAAGRVPSYPPLPTAQTVPAAQMPEGRYSGQQANMTSALTGSLSDSFSSMHLQPDSSRPLNLLQERHILPQFGVETVVPNLPNEFKKVNCNPEIMTCTLSTIPSTQSLLNKARLPLGLLIHPFKDLSQLPVIQSTVIVRCRSCRTYINPFVTFVDMRRWKCNLCFRVNDLPDEFNYDPVSKSYGEPQRRPEIKSSTIEFIAPSEYMLRPPQPAVYLFLLDVSFNAIKTGYLPVFCRTLLEEIDHLPGDNRTQIGFITYDSVLYFYDLDPEGSQQPKMLIVSETDEIFIPCPDGLLVNLNEAKEMVIDFLNKLPGCFEKNMQTGSALGPALQAAFKLMSPTGGRITVVQTQLPTVGAGSLKNREEPTELTGKKIQHLCPVTDFYKKLSLDCSAQQIAVDVFMLSAQYSDIATVAGISKYSGGTIHYFPGFHSITNPAEVDHFENTLHRYLTRKIGFEAVMRIRCTKGLSIHTFHGNFFVRSTDLLSLPNINPDAGFGVQVSIEDTLDVNYVSFQAALLYTSSKAERRIRVHTLCLPVTTVLNELFIGANQLAIIGLLSKMAVDKAVSTSLSDARDALINAAIDMLSAYRSAVNAGQSSGQLLCPYQLRLIALYVLAMLKSSAFRVGTTTKLDDRVFSMEQCKNLPLRFLCQMLHPDLYPVHALDDRNSLNRDDKVIPQPPLLPLSSGHIDRHGAYLMDAGTHMYLWLGASISDQFCQDVLGVSAYRMVPDMLCKLGDLSNPTINRLSDFINFLNDQRPYPASLIVMKEDSSLRSLFLQHLIEDRTESSLSYNEFLLHLQKEIKG